MAYAGEIKKLREDVKCMENMEIGCDVMCVMNE